MALRGRGEGGERGSLGGPRRRGGGTGGPAPARAAFGTLVRSLEGAADSADDDDVLEALSGDFLSWIAGAGGRRGDGADFALPPPPAVPPRPALPMRPRAVAPPAPRVGTTPSPIELLQVLQAERTFVAYER